MSETIEPGDVELKILQELWTQPGATARDIHNAVHAQQGRNYSTTVKMLSVMLAKGFIRRDDSVRPQTFFAVLSRKRAQKGLVTRLMQNAFNGSATSLAMQALTAARPSKEDLDEIRRLIDRLEEK